MSTNKVGNVDMSSASALLGRLGLVLAISVGLYAVLLGVLLTPPMQRFALYAHKLNTLFLGTDLSDGQAFGFAKNQVTAFNIRAPDGVSLYSWHILPLDVYARNEKGLREEERPKGRPVGDITQTLAFRLLSSADAKVVVSFHGNAGHIAQNQRPPANRYLTTQPNTHVLTIDYRGFGHSTGSPTESGLIADGITLVDWILNVAKVPPENIVILGQSLGTAVSSAVALHFADPGNSLIPSTSTEVQPWLEAKVPFKRTVFKGIVLAAPFNSVPTLLLSYRAGGLLPLLLPLRPVPSFADVLLSHMVDKWLTAERLTAYYDALRDSTALRSAQGNQGSLQIVHALDDADIPYHQTEMICRRMLGERDGNEALRPDEIDATQCIGESEGAGVLDVKRHGRPRLRFELVTHGGHNKIITYSPVALAIVRAFQDLFD